jgi:hypothetical protein
MWPVVLILLAPFTAVGLLASALSLICQSIAFLMAIMNPITKKAPGGNMAIKKL